MKLNTFLFLVVLPLVVASCMQNGVVPDNTDSGAERLGKTIKVDVVASVYDKSGEPVQGAAITCGNKMVVTDQFGCALINDVAVSEHRAVLSVNHAGFYSQVAVFASSEGAPSVVNIQCDSIGGPAGSTLADNAYVLDLGDWSLKFPANSFVLVDGTMPSGAVRVYAKSTQPDSASNVPSDGRVRGASSPAVIQPSGILQLEMRDQQGKACKLKEGVLVDAVFKGTTQPGGDPKTLGFGLLDANDGRWVISQAQQNVSTGISNTSTRGVMCMMYGSYVDDVDWVEMSFRCANGTVVPNMIVNLGYGVYRTAIDGKVWLQVSRRFPMSVSFENRSLLVLPDPIVITDQTSIQVTVPSCPAKINGVVELCNGDPATGYVVFREESKRACILPAVDGSIVGVLGLASNVIVQAFSLDGKQSDEIAVTASSSDESVLLPTLTICADQDNKAFYEVEVPNQYAYDFSLSPNGKFIAFAADDAVIVVDVQTGAVLMEKFNLRIRGNALEQDQRLFAWSTDSRRLLCKPQTGVGETVYDVLTGEQLVSDFYCRFGPDADLSPDGKNVLGITVKGSAFGTDHYLCELDLAKETSDIVAHNIPEIDALRTEVVGYDASGRYAWLQWALDQGAFCAMYDLQADKTAWTISYTGGSPQLEGWLTTPARTGICRRYDRDFYDDKDDLQLISQQFGMIDVSISESYSNRFLWWGNRDDELVFLDRSEKMDVVKTLSINGLKEIRRRVYPYESLSSTGKCRVAQFARMIAVIEDKDPYDNKVKAKIFRY